LARAEYPSTLKAEDYHREPEVTKGLRQIWLERVCVDKLSRLRGKGESWSEVILRLTKG